MKAVCLSVCGGHNSSEGTRETTDSYSCVEEDSVVVGLDAVLIYIHITSVWDKHSAYSALILLL
jgi:hypothetical protein